MIRWGIIPNIRKGALADFQEGGPQFLVSYFTESIVSTCIFMAKAGLWCYAPYFRAALWHQKSTVNLYQNAFTGNLLILQLFDTRHLHFVLSADTLEPEIETLSSLLFFTSYIIGASTLALQAIPELCRSTSQLLVHTCGASHNRRSVDKGCEIDSSETMDPKQVSDPARTLQIKERLRKQVITRVCISPSLCSDPNFYSCLQLARHIYLCMHSLLHADRFRMHAGTKRKILVKIKMRACTSTAHQSQQLDTLTGLWPYVCWPSLSCLCNVW